MHLGSSASESAGPYVAAGQTECLRDPETGGGGITNVLGWGRTSAGSPRCAELEGESPRAPGAGLGPWPSSRLYPELFFVKMMDAGAGDATNGAPHGPRSGGTSRRGSFTRHAPDGRINRRASRCEEAVGLFVTAGPARRASVFVNSPG